MISVIHKRKWNKGGEAQRTSLRPCHLGRDPSEVREWVTGVKGEREVQGERRVMQRLWGGSVPCAQASARWHTQQPNGGMGVHLEEVTRSQLTQLMPGSRSRDSDVF